MKPNEKRVIEYVLLVLFPVALFAGCAGNGNEKPKEINDNLNEQTKMYEPAAYFEDISSDKEYQNIELGPVKKSGQEIDSVETTEGPRKDSNETKVEPKVSDTQETSLDNIVYFDTNKFTLREEGAAVLAQYANKLLNDARAILIINGHADERGSEDYNLRLSELRAREVEGNLLSLGVQESQLRTRGFGEINPKESVANWRQNRRVELEFTNTLATMKDSDEQTDQIVGALKSEEIVKDAQ